MNMSIGVRTLRWLAPLALVVCAAGSGVENPLGPLAPVGHWKGDDPVVAAPPPTPPPPAQNPPPANPPAPPPPPPGRRPPPPPIPRPRPPRRRTPSPRAPLTPPGMVAPAATPTAPRSPR